MKPALLCLFALLPSLSALAADGAGAHGGRAVELPNGDLCLVELVEHGDCKIAIIDESAKPRKDYEEWIAHSLREIFPTRPKQFELIAKKITEIARISPIAADVLVQGIRRYFWSATELDLKPIEGDSVTVIDDTPYPTVQLAVRKDRAITVARHQLAKLDANPNVQVALIFHEIFYAFEDSKLAGEKGSQPARDMTAFVFSHVLTAEDDVTFRSLAEPLRLPLQSAQRWAPFQSRFETGIWTDPQVNMTFRAAYSYSEVHALTTKDAEALCERFFKDSSLRGHVSLEATSFNADFGNSGEDYLTVDTRSAEPADYGEELPQDELLFKTVPDCAQQLKGLLAKYDAFLKARYHSF